MSAALLALLQLSDSGFPSGSFAHSYGLEHALNERLVTNAEDVQSFVRSVVMQSTATADARACYAASTAARKGDLAALIEADRALFRTKAAVELREASVQSGRRLLEETVIHLEAPLLHSYADDVMRGEAHSCYPVAFGVVGAALEVHPADAATALLITSANTLLQAAMRLGRISHRDAQAVLHRLRPLLAELDFVAAPLHAYHPLQEIASMRHQRAEARLFAS